MSFTIRLAFIAAAMTAFLGFLVVSHTAARAAGTEIMLDVRGYDPRDILLGHYSVIATDLQQLDASLLEGEDEFTTGDSLYVVLAPGDDGNWRPVSLHAARPDGGTFIHGIVHSSYRVESDRSEPLSGDTRDEAVAVNRIWIRPVFNIERYYASREMALQFEQRLRSLDAEGSNGVRLILSLPASGNAIIKGFEIDGVRHLDALW